MYWIALLVLLLGCVRSTAASDAATAPGHQPVTPGEHPRLIVRGQVAVRALRERAATPWGSKVAARIRQAVKVGRKLSITGLNRSVIKEAGFQAAGHGAVHLLEADVAAADKARSTLMHQVVGYPMTGSLTVMERIARLRGAAVTYDLCYNAWDKEACVKTRTFLLAEARALSSKVGPPEAEDAEQPEHVLAWCAAGLAELAVLEDAPGSSDVEISKAARQRIARCEQAVTHYLKQHMGPGGFDANGESVRQAAFASGILSFVCARRLVLGRDSSEDPAVKSVLLPMVHLSMLGTGMPVTGKKTSAIDRTGLFALGFDLTPGPQRPAVAWLFDRIGGNRYLGVVRPHQGLHMLLRSVDAVTPAPPDDAWPRFVASDRAGYAVYRTGWEHEGDILTVVHNRGIRILGMGAQWAAHPGPHARVYSQDRGAGSLDNVFSLNPKRDKRLPSSMFVPVTRNGKTRMRPPGGGPNAGMLLRGGTVYRINESVRLTDATFDAAAKVGSAAFAFRGVAKRLATTYLARVTSDLAERPNDWETRPVPEGGPFEGRRVVGVDYSGRCGAPALIAVADRLTGVTGAARAWVLHVDRRCQIAAEGATFTVTLDRTTLRGTVVRPKGVTILCAAAGRVWNFIAIETTAQHIDVVMTLQRGKPPAVSATEGGLSEGVTVGKRAAKLKDNEVVFTD